jgi:hypothetical protein
MAMRRRITNSGSSGLEDIVQVEPLMLGPAKRGPKNLQIVSRQERDQVIRHRRRTAKAMRRRRRCVV